MARRSTRHPSSPTRFAIYTRVSTSKQEETGTSLESQLARCREHIAGMGGTLDPTHVYTDTKTGAIWRERTALQAMLAALRSRELDVVLCYDLDRLSRDQQDIAVIVDLIEDAGGRIEFVTEDFEQSALGRFMRNAKAFVAEIEREKIIERTVRGKRTRVLSGKVHNHAAELYGYHRDKERGVRIVQEDEAAVVRQIFTWAATGEPLRDIRRRLVGAGIPTPSESKGSKVARERQTHWGHGVVKRILNNPAYKGEPVAWRYRRTKDHRVELRPEDEWIPLPAESTPALVDPAIWQRVQDRLATNRGANARNETRPYLLRGLIVCGVCGRSMRSSPERNLRTYRCSSRETPHGPCGGKRVNANYAESWVWDEIKVVLQQPEIIEREIAERRASGPDEALLAERESLQRLIQRAERQQERLIALMRDDGRDAA